MHYIMAAWQQVSWQTIQNCFRKAGHRYQSDGNEMANDDDDVFSARTGKNCVEPRNTISKATTQWIAMWQQVALKLLKNYVNHLGLQGLWRKKMRRRWKCTRDGAETCEALQKVKEFFYVQSGSDADHENILSLEKSYFKLRQNSAKKQRTTYNFFC